MAEATAAQDPFDVVAAEVSTLLADIGVENAAADRFQAERPRFSNSK